MREVRPHKHSVEIESIAATAAAAEPQGVAASEHVLNPAPLSADLDTALTPERVVGDSLRGRLYIARLTAGEVAGLAASGSMKLFGAAVGLTYLAALDSKAWLVASVVASGVCNLGFLWRVNRSAQSVVDSMGAPAEHVREMVAALALQNGIECPEVRQDERIKSGFGVVRVHGRPDVVVYNPKALEQLNERELKNVLAHELAHVKRWDPLLMRVEQFLSVFSYPAVALAGGHQLFQALGWHGRFGTAAAVAAASVGGMLAADLFKAAANFVGSITSRSREFKADYRALQTTGDAEGLCSGVEKVQSFALDGNLSRWRRFILNVIGSHPSPDRRSAAVRRHAEES